MDMESAERFFKLAQDNLMNLVVISRHFSEACIVPKRLFDVLLEYGGEVGKSLYDTEKKAFENLWKVSCLPLADNEGRRGLPLHCTREWFLQTFCHSQEPEDSSDIWSAVKDVAIY